MKKRLFILMTLMTMVFVTACGNNENANDAANNVTGNKDNTINSSTSTEDKTSEEPVAKIQPVLEKDAYVDFAGIKVPMTITWEEFQKLVSDNAWKIVSDMEDAPSENNFHGDVEVDTNCGLVGFDFMPDAYDTVSVIEGVKIDYDILTDEVSICGISCSSKLADLDAVLKFEEADSETSKLYYIDEYLTVRMMNRDDDKFDMSISRLPWARRKVDIIDYLEHINANTELGEKIVIEAKENTNEKKDLYGRLTIAMPTQWVYDAKDLKVDYYVYNGNKEGADYINFCYNCNYVSAGRTCTEIEFSQEIKKTLDLWNEMNFLPKTISEVQIGKYEGYKMFVAAPSDSVTNAIRYFMWIDGYQMEFSINYFNSINPELLDEACQAAMQAIASIEKVK